ncbi:Uncharacterized protein SCF082_LOCUS9965, partial [Durusdinium trenchii]
SPLASVDESPALPPLKKQARIMDAVQALLRQGFITSDGKLIEMRDEAAAKLHQEIVVRKHPGGRPKKHELRGVAGGHKSNVRMKGEKQLRQDLPISHKHAICQHLFKEKESFASERDLMRHGKKKFGLRMSTLRYIWARRKQWATDMQKHKQSASKEHRSERAGAHGVHGHEKAKTQRVRASGAGAKIEFPELYESTKHWLEAERAHGHVVLPRHVSWKYESSLDQEIVRLEDVMKDEENPQQWRLLKDRIDRGKRQKKSLEKPKNQDKRARHLMSWMGAKVQAPNLVTQLSEVEQQVRAELTWNQFDFQTWKMSSKKDEVYHEMFAQPENAKKHVHQCVLGFSDQIPLWVKKPTSREVFAGFELRASAKSVSVHRQEIRQQLAQGATDKAAWPVQGEIVRAEGADGQIAEHDDPGLPFHEPSAHDAGKTHLTTMREVNVRDQAKKYPMSLWQRDCFGAAFQADVRKMQFLSHQVPCSVMAKMTSALQLTDTDFSHEFKAKVKSAVDLKMKEGAERMRADEAGPSDQYKMTLRDVASVIDGAMEHMIQSNEKKNWVIAGLRRNGMLVMRPQKDGSLKYQDEHKEEWCKGMPIGSSRISQDWLKNRMAWIKSGGNQVDEPIWARIEGAKELADLIEWSYTSGFVADEQEVMKLDEVDQPEWVAAGKFQLPLDLRRLLAKREAGMSSEGQEKREKLRQKRNQKKLRNDAKKQLDAEEREQIRASLQSKSKHEAMQQIVPSSRTVTPASKANAKKKSHKKGKSKDKLAVKYKKKDEIKKAALALAKKKKADEAEKANAPADAPPLPPPMEEPPEADEAKADESKQPVPPGVFRVVSDMAGMSLFGRQGTVMAIGENEWQIFLDEVSKNAPSKLVWIKHQYLQQIETSQLKKKWEWPQLSLSRLHKKEILIEAGTIGEDVDDQESWDPVEVIGPKCPDGGLEAQTIVFGWLLLQYMSKGKQLGSMDGITMLFPQLLWCLVNEKAEVDHERCLDALKFEMRGKDKIFLCPLVAGNHWTLMVVDKKSRSIRYYDSLRGSVDETEIGTEAEIQKMHEGCVNMAEEVLSKMLSCECIDEALLNGPPLRRENEKVRQPMMSNMCGHFMLSYMESEMSNHMGYGPASAGHAHGLAFAWHSRLEKMSKQLANEVPKMRKDLELANEKQIQLGKKSLDQMHKQHELAKSRMKKNEELTALMSEAVACLDEKKTIQIDQLPHEYHVARARI